MTLKKLFLQVLLVALAFPLFAQETLTATTNADTVKTVAPLATDSLLHVDSTLSAPTVDPATWRQQVKTQIDELLEDDLFQTTQVAVMVWDLTDDVAVYSHNGRQRMRPASTMKVVTAIAALDRLGTDYQFATRLYHTGDKADSCRTLHGNLYVVGGMDPKLEREDLKAFADSLKALQIDTIDGNLYADLSFKDKKRLGAGWCWDDEDDNPRLSPLTYNGKETVLSLFRDVMRSSGIVFTGMTSDAERPHDALEDALPPARDAQLVCTRYRSLSTVMRPMLKNSNNRCAEAVFYQLAHKEGGRWATAHDAAREENRTIRATGLDADDYSIADGSGLSLYNYVTAQLEVRLLRYAWSRKEIYGKLYPLLPIAGVDGTLRKRMKGTKAMGNVHAKTGTVTGVRSLAGYCTASNGHEIAFSIINQGVDDGAPARHFQDKVCRALCE